MSLPETDVTRARRWLDARNAELPPRASDEICFELDIDARSVTIFEGRPPWRDGFGPKWTRSPIARLRYTKTRREWEIMWRDRHSRFRRCDPVGPSANVESLLARIDADPTGIVWG